MTTQRNWRSANYESNCNTGKVEKYVVLTQILTEPTLKDKRN